jgi:hypothetical protein
MGQNYYSLWGRRRQRNVNYAGNFVWGTGINPIHAHRSPTGRPQNYREPLSDLDKRTLAALSGDPGFIETGPPWGVQPGDLAGLDTFADPQVAVEGYYYPAGDGLYPQGDEHTDWGDGPGFSDRANIPPDQSRPWQAPPSQRRWLRSQKWAGSPRGAATTAYASSTYQNSSEIPNETVSEGWINKGVTGGLLNSPENAAEPADVKQVFVQTSMVQRNRTLNNDRAVMRGQDEPRESIHSRLAGPKIKTYSGEDENSNRHYDMTPREAQVIPRPFRYRSFGRGPQGYALNNEQYLRTSMQRTPPSDPGLGTPDLQMGNPNEAVEAGYTDDDQGWF